MRNITAEANARREHQESVILLGPPRMPTPNEARELRRYLEDAIRKTKWRQEMRLVAEAMTAWYCRHDCQK